MDTEDSLEGHVDAPGARVHRVRKRRRVRVQSARAVSLEVTSQPKVRKRRRRRSQPEQRERLSKAERSPAVLCGAFCGIAGLFLLALYTAFVVAFHNSQHFKTSWLERAGETLDAELSLKNFQVRETQAAARVLEVDWKTDAHVVEKLELSRLTSDLFVGELWSMAWSPKKVEAGKGKLILDSVNWANGSLPQSLGEGYQLHCRELDIFLSEEKEAILAGASMQVFTDSEQKRVLLAGGAVKDGIFSGLRLQQAYLRVEGARTQVSARFDDEQSTESLSLHGDLERGKPVEFSLTAQNARLSRLLRGGLKEVLLGAVSGKNGRFEVLPEEGWLLEQKFETSEFQLRGFECFSLLAEVLGKPSYVRPSFEEKGEFTVEQKVNECAISGLELSAKNFLKVRGELREDSATGMHGVLRLGVPQRYAGQLRRAFGEHAFTKESGGYLWQSVDISQKEGGGLTDNLASMLLSSPGDAKVERYDPDRLFDELLKD